MRANKKAPRLGAVKSGSGLGPQFVVELICDTLKGSLPQYGIESLLMGCAFGLQQQDLGRNCLLFSHAQINAELADGFESAADLKVGHCWFGVVGSLPWAHYAHAKAQGSTLATRQSAHMEEPRIAFEFNEHALRLLYQATKQAHTNWAGGDPQEQQALAGMSLRFYAAWLDVTYAP